MPALASQEGQAGPYHHRRSGLRRPGFACFSPNTWRRRPKTACGSVGDRASDDLPAVVLLEPHAHELQRSARLWTFVGSLAGPHGGSAVIEDLHVAHLHASELRPSSGLVSFDDLRFGKNGLTVLRDQHRVVSQSFLEELEAGPSSASRRRSSSAPISV
jgi:hypothetical protein